MTPEERAERALRLTETFGGHRVEERDRVAAEIRAAEQAEYLRGVVSGLEGFGAATDLAEKQGRREAFLEAAEMFLPGGYCACDEFNDEDHMKGCPFESIEAALRARAEEK